MTELQEAVTEWQNARKAIFAYTHKATPDDEQKAIWNRLAEAEDRLMKL